MRASLLVRRCIGPRPPPVRRVSALPQFPSARLDGEGCHRTSAGPARFLLHFALRHRRSRHRRRAPHCFLCDTFAAVGPDERASLAGAPLQHARPGSTPPRPTAAITFFWGRSPGQADAVFTRRSAVVFGGLSAADGFPPMDPCGCSGCASSRRARPRLQPVGYAPVLPPRMSCRLPTAGTPRAAVPARHGR